MENLVLFMQENWLTLSALSVSLLTPLVFFTMKFWDLRVKRLSVNKDAIEYARKRSQILREIADLEFQWNKPIQECQALKGEIKRCYYGNAQDGVLQSLDALEQYCGHAKQKINQTYQALVNKEAFYDPILLEQKTPTLYKIAQKNLQDMEQVRQRILQIRSTITSSTFYFRPLPQVS